MPTTRLLPLLALASLAGGCQPSGPALDARYLPADPPNIVIIFTDDQGYGDVGCFGATGYETPNLDRLAETGVRFTDFYAAATVCTPSRAALLTGCYPKRVGLHEAVIFPEDTHGLNPDEVILAELLQAQGYATGCFGKWHLGHQPAFLPTRQGFDVYFGLPYSNDMTTTRIKREGYPPLPLIEGEIPKEFEPDQSQLTRRYTERAVRFIREHAEERFFVYLPHSMPHFPVFASEKFAGRHERIYDDVIEEIDWSVGEIQRTLEELGLAENTLLFFSSDNGPATWYGDQGGSPGGLRGAKGSTWEGGQRVPTLMAWPDVIPGGTVCRTPATNMDLLPTIAHLVGAKLPEGRTIDGHDLSDLLRDPDGAKLHERPFVYYARNGKPEAIRVGKWKLHLTKTRGWDQKKQGAFTPQLYDLVSDPGEQHDLAAKHPEIVKRLEKLLQAIDAEIELGARPVGRAT
jgi:arylsulfatase A